MIVGTTGSVTLTHLLHRQIGWADVSFFKLKFSGGAYDSVGLQYMLI